MTDKIPIHLDKPLAFIDIEATGLNPRTDRIIELAIAIITNENNEKMVTLRFNPQVPIPSEATAIHGISDKDVASCPTFKEKADEILNILGNNDIAGFNVARFDIPILLEEFYRASKTFSLESRRIIDIQRIFHKKEPRDLSAALMFYCGEQHDNAHGAEADVKATIKVFKAQLSRYPDLPHSVDALHEYCDSKQPDWVDISGRLKWVDGEIIINFGKKRGKKLRDIIKEDPNFIKWMLNSDFPSDTREIIRRAVLEGKWPSQPPIKT